MIRARPLMDPWRDTLLTELRLGEMPGERIGEVLAEVDDFCTESGQTPQDAFGDPAHYAQVLLAAWVPPRQSPVRRLLLASAQTFATLAGVFALLSGVGAVAGDGRGVVTAGQLLSVALGTAAFPAMVTVLFRPAVFRRGAAWAAVFVTVPLVLAVPVLLWPVAVLHTSGWVLLAGGLFLLAAGSLPLTGERAFADRVIDPRTGREPFAPSRWLIAVVRWSLPVALLAAAVVTAVIR